MPDCIIVGGGVIGLLTARQLFLEGVTVLPGQPQHVIQRGNNR